MKERVYIRVCVGHTQECCSVTLRNVAISGAFDFNLIMMYNVIVCACM